MNVIVRLGWYGCLDVGVYVFLTKLDCDCNA